MAEQLAPIRTPIVKINKSHSGGFSVELTPEWQRYFTLKENLPLVKRVQRGTISVAAAVNSGTATITAVNTEKAHLAYLGASNDGGGAAASVVFRVELTNSTTVTATRAATAGNAIVSFEVIEYQ